MGRRVPRRREPELAPLLPFTCIADPRLSLAQQTAALPLPLSFTPDRPLPCLSPAQASLGRWRPALDALSEEIAGRVGSLSIKEAQSIEQSFCVMKRRSPFSGEKVTRVHAGDGGGVTPLYT